MILVIDNYDSFTYNLVHYVEELGAETLVRRNDKITVEEVFAMAPDGVILSPGPCTPNEAGICLDLIARAPEQLPILGVCLGHQAIGQAFGGVVRSARAIMHGKVSTIHCRDNGLFRGLPATFDGTRYHSLAVERATLPDCFEIDAETGDGEIMGMHHKTRPIYGIQFHPESIATEHGHAMLANFLKAASEARS